MIRLLILLIMLPTLSFAVPSAPTNVVGSEHTLNTDARMPQSIFDNGSENWISDMYLGNFAQKNIWHDGPRLEVGGMHQGSGACTQGDGKMYCSFGLRRSEHEQSIIEIDDTTGVARLLMDRTGAYIGDVGEVKGGYPFYGNGTLYIAGSNCVRKVVDDLDGTRSVALVAGECGTPCVSGCDGIGAAARFGAIYGQVAMEDGNIYVIEGGEFRKIDSNGVVTTPVLVRAEAPTDYRWKFIPVFGNFLSIGEDSNTLYLSDYYNSGTAVGKSYLRIDLPTTMTRLAGVIGTAGGAGDPYSNGGGGYDGPLLHASYVGGCQGLYSPFYGESFFGSPDDARFRTLTTDSQDGLPWMKTVLNLTRPGTTFPPYTVTVFQGSDISSENAATRIQGGNAWVVGTDDRGGVYYNLLKDLNSVWRAYNPSKGGTK